MALAEGVAAGEQFGVGQVLVNLYDEIVQVVLVADDGGNLRRVALRIEIQNVGQRGIDGRDLARTQCHCLGCSNLCRSGYVQQEV